MITTSASRITDFRPSQIGDLVRHDGRVYAVALINGSRMRLDPVQGVEHDIVGHVVTTYGASVNVSPDAIFEHVEAETLTPEQLKRKANLEKRSAEMSETQAVESKVSAMPVPTKTARAKDIERRGKLAETKAAKAKANGANGKAKVTVKAGSKDRPKRERAPKVVRKCACGCGGETTGYFVMGHDARFKGWLLKIERGEMEVSDLKKDVREAYKWVKTENGMRPTTNYKGEPHKGYDI